MSRGRVRIRFRSDGKTISVTGVDWHAFRGILDAASLDYMHDRTKSPKGSAARAYYESQLTHLRLLRAAVDEAIEASFPSRPSKPLTKADRWARLDASRRDREFLDAMISEALKVQEAQEAARKSSPKPRKGPQKASRRPVGLDSGPFGPFPCPKGPKRS